MPNMPDWEVFEYDVREVLGLDSTVCSGNQFNDPGDGVDRRHPSEGGFRMMVDAKFTEKGSWSINAKKFKEWFDRAAEMGLRGAVAVRLRPPGNRHRDYVILDLNDFAELLNDASERAARSRYVDRAVCQTTNCHCTGACIPPMDRNDRRGL